MRSCPLILVTQPQLHSVEMRTERQSVDCCFFARLEESGKGLLVYHAARRQEKRQQLRPRVGFRLTASGFEVIVSFPAEMQNASEIVST